MYPGQQQLHAGAGEHQQRISSGYSNEHYRGKVWESLLGGANVDALQGMWHYCPAPSIKCGAEVLEAKGSNQWTSITAAESAEPITIVYSKGILWLRSENNTVNFP